MAYYISTDGQILDANKSPYIHSGISYKKVGFRSGQVYTITNTPGVNDYLVLNGATYAPGDILQFRGNFKHLTINNLVGTSNSPIVIQNYPGEVCRIGNTNWNPQAGQPAQAVSMKGCKYFVFQGTTTDRNSLIIDADQSLNRIAYRNLELDLYTDNFEFRYLSILNGGNGVFYKKEVDMPGSSANDYKSWYGSGITLDNAYFHHITLDNQRNEQFYIGHTAEWWDTDTSAGFYPEDTGHTNGYTANSLGRPYYPGVFIDTAADHVTGIQTTAQAARFKKPIYLRNVRVMNCTCINGNGDAVQTAHVDGLEVAYNYIFNWATLQGSGSPDVGGILVGGGCINTNIHDNIVDNGGSVNSSRLGEPFQFYGMGGGTHAVTNNLFIGTPGSGEVLSYNPRSCPSKGVTAGANLVLTNNTFVYGSHSLRINHAFEWDAQRPTGKIDHPVTCAGNLLVEASEMPFGNSTRRFIYTENGNGTTQITESNDVTKDTVTLASFVQTTNRALTTYYQPAVSQGFRNNPTT